MDIGRRDRRGGLPAGNPSRASPRLDMALLSLDAVYLQFGGVAALSGVSLEVHPHDFLAIIGPNGAGKTSIFNCISGIMMSVTTT